MVSPVTVPLIGSASAASLIADPDLLNYDPAYMRRSMRAMGNVQAGIAPMVEVVIGDSNSAGWRVGTGLDGLTGARALSWPSLKAAMLNGMGIPARADAFFGWQAMTSVAGYMAYNPLVVLTGWNESDGSIGGNLFRSQAAANPTNAPLAFTPLRPFNAARIWYTRSTASGVFTVDVDGGGALATVDTVSTANGLSSVTVSATLGLHTLNIRRTAANANSIYIMGVEVWNSITPEVRILNLSAPGSTIGAWALSSAPWKSLPAVAALMPDFTSIRIATNDMKDNTTALPDFSASLVSVIDNAQASGDVSVSMPLASQITRAPVARQDAFAAEMLAVSKTKRCVFQNLTRRVGTWAEANALGLTFDDLHYRVQASAMSASLSTRLSTR